MPGVPAPGRGNTTHTWEETMGNMFGGKLTGGIFAVIGAIIGIIMVGIMAAPFGSLVAYFEPAAQDNDEARFSRVYVAVTGDSIPNRTQINTDTDRAGGGGFELTGTAGNNPTFSVVSADSTLAGFSATQDLSTLTFYNEQGDTVTVTGTLASSAGTGTVTSAAWREPPEAFDQLNFLNSILVTLLALVAAVGLIMKTKSAYDAFGRGGVRDLTPVVILEVTTLVLGIVGVYLAPTMLNILANTAIRYTSGQFDFSFVGSILEIVFAVVPTMIIVGIMGLVSGTHAIGGLVGRTAGRYRGRMRGMRMSRRRAMMYR